jgi:hypothetical protein
LAPEALLRIDRATVKMGTAEKRPGAAGDAVAVEAPSRFVLVPVDEILHMREGP